MMADVQRVRAKVRTVLTATPIVMFTTLDEHGIPASRPMRALLEEGDARVHFLTPAGSQKVAHLAVRPQVNVTLEGTNSTYLSMNGTAAVSQDREMIGRLWQPSFRAWFPEGTEDAAVTIVSVILHRVELWEAPSSRAVRLLHALEALITGRPVETAKQVLDGL